MILCKLSSFNIRYRVYAKTYLINNGSPCVTIQNNRIIICNPTAGGRVGKVSGYSRKIWMSY